MIFHKDSLNFYIDEMQKLLNEVEYFNENDLQNVHQKTKNEAVEKVRNVIIFNHEVRYFLMRNIFLK